MMEPGAKAARGSMDVLVDMCIGTSVVRVRAEGLARWALGTPLSERAVVGERDLAGLLVLDPNTHVVDVGDH